MSTRGVSPALDPDRGERAGLLARAAPSLDDAERLLRITGAIANAVSSSEVFEAIVDHVAEGIEAWSAALWLVDQDGRTVKLAHGRGLSELATDSYAIASVEATPRAPFLDAIKLDRPVWLPSQEDLFQRYPHLREVVAPRACRMACLPLRARDRVLGVLGLTIDGEGEASEQERSFLLLIAGYAAQALERLRLLEAESRSRMQSSAAASRLELLSRASRGFVASDLEHDRRLRHIAGELAMALDGSVEIRLFGRDSVLRVAAHHPAEAARPVEPAGGASEMPLAIAATGRSVLDDGLIGAALQVRGETIGAVTVRRPPSGRPYTEDDLGLLEDLADRAAVAIENSRLYQEALDARTHAERLYGFAQAAAAADSIDAVLGAASDAVESLLGVQRSAILILDREGVMKFRACRNLSPGYCAAVEGHSPWPPGAIAPEPVLVADVTSDPAMSHFLPLFHAEGIGALAFIPLVSSGQLVGKLMVYQDRPRAFLPHEVELAQAIASHVASVITRFAAVAELEETVRYNELFAGILAHDLRNPLGAMMMGSEVVLERSADEKVRSPLRRVLKSGERMNRMIEQLLDFTRVRLAGGLELHPRPSSLTSIARHAVEEVELSFTGSMVRLDATGDLRGEWDEDRMAQVFSNLAGNAVQHGAAGHAVRFTLNGREPDAIEIEVWNRGVIDPALVPQLFEPFRHTQHRRDGSKGLGLGLFITQQIVRAHGGEITVTSTEAKGTTFRIRMPRPALSAAAGSTPHGGNGARAGADRESAAHAPASGPIVVVDDDPDIREALSDLLIDRGFAVVTAMNGADALQVIRALDTPPSVVLLDMMMPVMDGYGFLDERRKDPVLSAVPVAVITAGHGVDHARLDDLMPILPKPIDVARLMETVRRLRGDRSPT